MWRVFLFASAVGGAFYAGWTLHPRANGGPVAAPPKPVIGSNGQTCSDDCEQRVVVGQMRESELAGCRTRCGDSMPVSAPHEVPRSISVAPADHRQGLHPPPDRRISTTTR